MSVASLHPEEFITKAMQIYKEMTEIENNLDEAETAAKITRKLPVSLSAFEERIDKLAKDQLAKVEGPYKKQITLCNEKCAEIQTKLDTVHFVRITNLIDNIKPSTKVQLFLKAVDQIEQDMHTHRNTSPLAVTSNGAAMNLIAEIRRACDPKPPLSSSNSRMDVSGPGFDPSPSSDAEESSDDEEDKVAILEKLKRENPEAYAAAMGISSSFD